MTTDFPKRYQVDTLFFSRTNYKNVVPALESFFSFSSDRNYVCVSNVHVTVECRSDLRLRDIQNNSFLTVADGQPIVMYGRLSGVRDIERIMGPDLMTEVFTSPQARARRHFFLGGTQPTLDAMMANLKARFPGLNAVGSLSPPFRAMSPEEKAAQNKTILDAAPDYLWICFGAPKQEYWMAENHTLFPKSLLIGIGAGFAYHAGELRRAPVWAQKMALEWLWRLLQDPKRLWKRYLKTNPVFLFLLIKLVFRQRASISG